MGKIGLQTQDKCFTKNHTAGPGISPVLMVLENWSGHKSRKFRKGTSQFQTQLYYLLVLPYLVQIFCIHFLTGYFYLQCGMVSEKL